MDKLAAVMSRFPQFAYDKDNTQLSLSKLIKAIVDEFNITMDNVDRVNRLLNINNVLPEDIYDRFGVLLNIKKHKNETYEQYRMRLKVSITSLAGGTAEAIKFAIASGLGILDDPTAMDRIQVYDAWEYTGDASVERGYGYIVCAVDLNNGRFSVDMDKTVTESVDNVKAAGVSAQFVYYNFRIVYYVEMDSITYSSLSTMLYNQVGEQ